MSETKTSPKVVIMYSGGLVSFKASERIVGEHGTDGVVALFADTMIEDADLYRFLHESTRHLGIELVTVCDGRTPWQVYRDEKFIGNSRVDPCSKILKRKLMERWVEENCSKGTILVYGLDWSERHRIEDHVVKGKTEPGHRSRVLAMGYLPQYPMNEKPYLTKDDIIADLHAIGIKEPYLYTLGFNHNNCGGFCCKMGHAQARHLLAVLPDRYREHEEEERRLLAEIPTTRPFLRYRSRGRTRGVTMEQFRKIVEQQPMLFDDHGWGCGGGCAID